MNKKYLTVGVICLLLCLIFIIMLIPRKSDLLIDGGPADPMDTSKHADPATTDSKESTGELHNTSSPVTDGDTIVTDSTSAAEPEAYATPVDFDKLTARCKDVYSWLQIPGTDITYPVVQHSKDDEYYLRRDLDGKYANDGTLFTQHTHNSKNYDDPVTIIYGHRLRSGGMFGKLQEMYSDEDSFEKYQSIIIYLPDRELHYTVFAAVSYGSEHIMYKYKDFKSSGQLSKFLDVIYATRGFDKMFDKSVKVGDDDNILVLSTCLQGTNTKRYLVLAKLTEVIS